MGAGSADGPAGSDPGPPASGGSPAAAPGSPRSTHHVGRTVGRVAVALDGDNAWALWLREEFGGASLWLARLAPDLSRERERVKVATLKAHGIAAGYPRLALRDGTAYIVWTDSDGTLTQLQGARFVPKQ